MHIPHEPGEGLHAKRDEGRRSGRVGGGLRFAHPGGAVVHTRSEVYNGRVGVPPRRSLAKVPNAAPAWKSITHGGSAAAEECTGCPWTIDRAVKLAEKR